MRGLGNQDRLFGSLGLAATLFRRFHGSSLVRFWGFGESFRLRIYVKVTATGLAQLNVLAAHDHRDLPDGDTHMASGANLIADQCDSFSISGAQTVVMAKDWLWNFAA
jgi:hypothetical protein